MRDYKWKSTVLLLLLLSLLLPSLFAEPLGELELRLFQAALPHCLKVDSAPFRQRLVTSLKKVFVRLRDSCSTALRRKTQALFVGECIQHPTIFLYTWVAGPRVAQFCRASDSRSKDPEVRTLYKNNL